MHSENNSQQHATPPVMGVVTSNQECFIHVPVAACSWWLCDIIYIIYIYNNATTYDCFTLNVTIFLFLEPKILLIKTSTCFILHVQLFYQLLVSSSPGRIYIRDKLIFKVLSILAIGISVFQKIKCICYPQISMLHPSVCGGLRKEALCMIKTVDFSEIVQLCVLTTPHSDVFQRHLPHCILQSYLGSSLRLARFYSGPHSFQDVDNQVCCRILLCVICVCGRLSL